VGRRRGVRRPHDRAAVRPVSGAPRGGEAHILGFADDVGVIPVDHPALAHELDEIRYVYPHARSLIVLVGEQNKASMQSRYLPTANHELYQTEEVKALLLGRIRLEGKKELFRVFPRLFPVYPGESLAHRLAWRARRAWRLWRHRVGARRPRGRG
jgi:hypothetical protein